MYSTWNCSSSFNSIPTSRLRSLNRSLLFRFPCQNFVHICHYYYYYYYYYYYHHHHHHHHYYYY